MRSDTPALDRVLRLEAKRRNLWDYEYVPGPQPSRRDQMRDTGAELAAAWEQRREEMAARTAARRGDIVWP